MKREIDDNSEVEGPDWVEKRTEADRESRRRRARGKSKRSKVEARTENQGWEAGGQSMMAARTGSRRSEPTGDIRKG